MADAPVVLLWTGGWDSTFRLLQLLLAHRLPVAPLYLVDDTRASATMELATMDRIRAVLAERYPDTRELLRPTTRVRVADLAPDRDIQHACHRLAAKHAIGSQYDWLARHARQCGMRGIEMACECIPQGASNLLLTRTIPAQAPQGFRTYRVDPGEPDPDVHLVFGRFTYPLIATTRAEMIDIAGASGWRDLMDMTWFCHRPARGAQPCGLCHPCLANIAEGFAWRIPRRRRALSAVYRCTLLPVRDAARQVLLRLRVAVHPSIR